MDSNGLNKYKYYNKELAEKWDPDVDGWDDGIIGYLVIPGFGVYDCVMPSNPYKDDEYDLETKLDFRPCAFINNNGEIEAYGNGYDPAMILDGGIDWVLDYFKEIHDKVMADVED